MTKSYWMDDPFRSLRACDSNNRKKFVVSSFQSFLMQNEALMDKIMLQNRGFINCY